MDVIYLKEYLRSDLAARVEDRLGLPYGSVEYIDSQGQLLLRIDPILSEEQKKQLKAFLGNRIA